jgi:hypothetical protein
VVDSAKSGIAPISTTLGLRITKRKTRWQLALSIMAGDCISKQTIE